MHLLCFQLARREVPPRHFHLFHFRHQLSVLPLQVVNSPLVFVELFLQIPVFPAHFVNSFLNRFHCRVN